MQADRVQRVNIIGRKFQNFFVALNDFFMVTGGVNVRRAKPHPNFFVGRFNGGGFGVIIAAAGLAAHLAGVLAANTVLPVIGVPCKGGALNGVDALYATVQMPTGIPVATVAIDGGSNAAILACQILALGDEALSLKLSEYKESLAASVEQRDARLQTKINEM